MSFKYICECNCEVDENDIITISTMSSKGSSTKQKVCPVHKGRIFERSTICAECGERFYFSKFGKKASRCLEHRKSHHKKHVKEKMREKYQGKTCHVAHWRGDYCKVFEGCSITNDLICDTCNRFIGIFKGVDPLKTRQVINGF